MFVILRLVLWPHVEEGRVLPLQTSHAQHRTCLCQKNVIFLWLYFHFVVFLWLFSHPGVGFPLKILIEPPLPHPHQLHHLKMWKFMFSIIAIVITIIAIIKQVLIKLN